MGVIAVGAMVAHDDADRICLLWVRTCSNTPRLLGDWILPEEAGGPIKGVPFGVAHVAAYRSCWSRA
jgi:hypothetical protein